MHKLLAFLRRDFKVQISYPLGFFMQLWGIFFQLILYYFLAKTFGVSVSPYLSNYGGDYFPFIIIGIAFSSFVYQSLYTFSAAISSQQHAGTLEAQLVTQTSLPTILIGSGLWQYIFTSFRVVLYIVMGMIAFGLRINAAGIFPAIIILILGVISAMAIGILSATFTVVYKQGNPIDFLISGMSTFFGGVYFPISVLPGWLQGFANLFPIYHCLEGLRLSLLKGYSLFQLWPQILGLSIFSFILFPISLWLFSLGIKRAKREGTLAHY